ncbi:MAG TPA: FAD-dependent monooxygenase [Alphaproteobacteria bacterium]|nr:FAD-dependent monooxygenase [Alphaproteobacteria bacterium]
MRILIVGAGPAGLYLAYLLKRSRLKVELELHEQNPKGATFGFGLAFSARALEFLARDDRDTYAALEPALELWSDSVIVHRGREVRIDGMTYSGIARLKLLEILQDRARAVGVEPRYEHALADVDASADAFGADLIVGADGANSAVRRGHERAFGTTISELTNRFAWYGAPVRYEALTHTFLETEWGHFNAHHHRQNATSSTFVVEVDQATYFRAGFDKMPQEEAQRVCERVFERTLGGAKLIANKSIWRRFPKIANARWSVGRRVLLGDALHTAHFSIGSGTRLALEDAIALARALETHEGDIPAALAAFEAARKPIVAKLVAAANASAEWYEHFGAHMRLSPMEFAMSYITRSGRVDRERLRKLAPGFVAAYEAASP